MQSLQRQAHNFNINWATATMNMKLPKKSHAIELLIIKLARKHKLTPNQLIEWEQLCKQIYFAGGEGAVQIMKQQKTDSPQEK